MANIYVRSTDGNNADSGATWALAKATLAGAAAIDAAGDTIWVSQVNNESTAAAVTLALAGTRAAPTRLLCGNDAAEPPTSLTTGGTMTTTLASSITVSGFVYAYGVTFSIGSGNNLANFVSLGAAGDWQTFERCSFVFVAIQGSNALTMGSGGKLSLIDCTFKFASTSQGLSANGALHVKGGSILSGGSNLLVFLKAIAGGSSVLVEDFDFSNFSSTLTLATTPGQNAAITFRNCKLPASWSGSLASSLTSACRVSMYNCDSGNTNYRLWIEDYCGNVKTETTLIKSGGATDGSTHISWKMASNGNASYSVQPLYSDAIAVWVEVGSPTSATVTVTVEILHDSATNLKNDEVWLDVAYLLSGIGSPVTYLGTYASDAKADFAATAADQDSSSVSWTTTGMTNPNKQKLVATFMPERTGFVYCRVALGKASKTIYVDPIVTVA